MRKTSVPLDMALGGLFALAAIGFAIVAFFSGIASNSHSTEWYISALTFGILAGTFMLDELGPGTGRTAGRFDAALGTLLMLGSLFMGAVGFILALANHADVAIWQASGVILAILALTTMVDELRRTRTGGAGRMDSFAGLAVIFGLIGLALGVIGFIVGLAGHSGAMTWLWGGAVSSVIALAWDFEAEHRDVAVDEAVVVDNSASRMGRTGPIGS